MTQGLVPAREVVTVQASNSNSRAERRFSLTPKVTSPVVAAPAATEGSAQAEGAQPPAVVVKPGEVSSETTTTPGAELTRQQRADAAAESARKSSKIAKARKLEAERWKSQADNLSRQNQTLLDQQRQFKEFQDNLKQDPYAALKTLGMTEQELANRAIKEGSPEALYEKLAQQLQDERNERLRLEKSIADQKQAVHMRTVETQYLAQAGDATKYPYLQYLPSETILSETQRIVREYKQKGGDPSQVADHDWLEFLDLRCKKHIEGRKLGQTSSSESSENSSGATSTVPKPTPKTLTNTLGTNTGSAAVDRDKLTRQEQKALLAADLKAALRKK